MNNKNKTERIEGFSTEEQVKESYQNLANSKIYVCTGCNKGVIMCHHMPCMGTVEDIERLIDAGYANKLMLDWWSGVRSEGSNNPFLDDIPYLVPAIEGLEGQKAPFIRQGKCNLLVDSLCSLHDKGLKPIQGRIACCNDTSSRTEDFDDRWDILHTWNTQKGRDLIERWKIEVGFTGDDSMNIPRNDLELMASFIELTMMRLNHHDKMVKMGLYNEK